LSEATVLINSFDAYAECWEPVSHGIRKYWPDCPFPVILMTEERDFDYPGVRVLKVGRDAVWSNRMIIAVRSITTPFVVYFQEDYWLNERVDNARILHYLTLMGSERLDYLRLLSKPAPDLPFEPDLRLGVLADDAPYRTSAQIAIWRRDVLLDLLVPGESVWEFELKGSPRSRKYGRSFVSIKRDHGDDYANGIRYVCTAVNGGKWSRMARPYAEAEGLSVDFSTRPTDTWWDDFKRSGPLGYFFRDLTHRLAMLIADPAEFGRRARARLGQRRG
jgi:hypothetical protein